MIHNRTLFAVTSVITTAAAAQGLHADMNLIKDPGILLENVDNSIMFYAFTMAFVFATIGVNIVANLVSAVGIAGACSRRNAGARAIHQEAPRARFNSRRCARSRSPAPPTAH